MNDIDIRFEEENSRSAAYDGDRNIGECTYSIVQGTWVIDHTFVEKTYGGRGIAKKLVKKVVDAAEKLNKDIIPVCPFAVKEFEENESYQKVISDKYKK